MYELQQNSRSRSWVAALKTTCTLPRACPRPWEYHSHWVHIQKAWPKFTTASLEVSIMEFPSLEDIFRWPGACRACQFSSSGVPIKPQANISRTPQWYMMRGVATPSPNRVLEIFFLLSSLFWVTFKKNHDQNPCPHSLYLTINISWVLSIHWGLEEGLKKILDRLHLCEFCQ